MGGNSEDFYEHSADENWASDISRPLNSMTIMFCNTMLPMYKKNQCHRSINEGVKNDAKKIPFSPMQVKNKPRDEIQIVRLFLNWVRLQTIWLTAVGAFHFVRDTF